VRSASRYPCYRSQADPGGPGLRCRSASLRRERGAGLPVLPELALNGSLSKVGDRPLGRASEARQGSRSQFSTTASWKERPGFAACRSPLTTEQGGRTVLPELGALTASLRVEISDLVRDLLRSAAGIWRSRSTLPRRRARAVLVTLVGRHRKHLFLPAGAHLELQIRPPDAQDQRGQPSITISGGSRAACPTASRWIRPRPTALSRRQHSGHRAADRPSPKTA